MEVVKGPLLAVIGVLLLIIIVNIGITIYEPTALKSAVKSTQAYNAVIDGSTINLTGNGQTAIEATQEVRDNTNLVRWIVNILGGVVFLLVVIFAVIGMLGKKHG